jgi:hypothetical protein
MALLMSFVFGGSAFAGHLAGAGWTDRHATYPAVPNGLAAINTTFGPRCTSDSLAEAQAAATAAQQTFGHLQGFYIDEAANYQLVGVYEQTSANQRVVPCADWERETKMECPPGLSEVRAYEPVKLRHVPRANARSFLSAKDEASCGSPGFRPCARHRLHQLLTDDLALKPDRFLLLNAYRTKKGAAEGVEFARMAVDDVSVLRVRKIGGGYVGLGQEAHPNGSGPLDGPLPDAAKYQE